MTTWDKIYKNFKKGGEAWATLSEGLIPQFIKFVEETDFTTKNVLDIGFGTGKYLNYLNEKGFEISGIDSSETAVEMTKKMLPNSKLTTTDMFEYQIPANKHDFIISISTIHHGLKQDVQDLLDKIYDALLSNGKIFITLPDFERGKKWHTFKDHEELAPETYAPLSGPEKGLAHSFYSKEEIKSVFSKFRNLNLGLDEIGRWIITAEK